MFERLMLLYTFLLGWEAKDKDVSVMPTVLPRRCIKI